MWCVGMGLTNIEPMAVQTIYSETPCPKVCKITKICAKWGLQEKCCSIHRVSTKQQFCDTPSENCHRRVLGSIPSPAWYNRLLPRFNLDTYCQRGRVAQWLELSTAVFRFFAGLEGGPSLRRPPGSHSEHFWPAPSSAGQAPPGAVKNRHFGVWNGSSDFFHGR